MADYNKVPVKNNMKIEEDNNGEELAPKEKKQLTKLIDVQPKKVKRGLMGRLVTGLLGPEGIPSIGSYVNDEIIKPAIKNIIVDAVTSGINQLMYRGEGPNRGGRYPHSGGSRSHYQPRTNYANNYRPSNHEPDERRIIRTSRYGVDEYVIDDRVDASEVLSTLCETADRYGSVSVADYYDLIGVPSRYTDNNHGWTLDLITRATIVHNRGGGYVIKFPSVEEI